MTEQEKRLHRACFTGHRPEKLVYTEGDIKSWLYEAILRAISEGYTTFITGMALGVDIWAAELVLQFRQSNPEIHLICASPYEGFEKKWSLEWQKRYREIMDKADLVRFISPHYSRTCFQIRNEWMVDHSNLVIGVYNGTKGGTRNTMEYARRKGVEVRWTEG